MLGCCILIPSLKNYMEPSSPAEQSVGSVAEAWHAPLNKVTVLSKVTAAIVFITLPFVGFWVGYTQAPVKEVGKEVPDAAINTLPQEFQPPSFNEPTDTTVMSGFVPSAQTVSLLPPTNGIEPFLADETTATYNMGEYLIRYKKDFPFEMQIISSGTVMQRLTINASQEELLLPSNELLIVDNDFNFDGHRDLGVYVGTNRSLYRYMLFVFKANTAQLEPLVIVGADGDRVIELTQPSFDTSRKTIKTIMLSPREDGNMNEIIRTYSYNMQEYIETEFKIAPWNAKE